MPLHFTPIPTEIARHYQAGGADANGQTPERVIATAGANPCRHCLTLIPEGAPMLILAHRPFPAPQPYAEVGPIFLCADRCEAPKDDTATPEVLASPDYILRGYSADHRIVYGSGAVVATGQLRDEAVRRFADPRIAYCHVRSARNNCFQVRIDRG